MRQIQRLGTTNPLTHFYRQSDGSIGTRRLFTALGQASGFGDLVIRVKGSAFRKNSAGVAVGLDFRIPSGDALNLLGTGAPGLQPFVVVSGTLAGDLTASQRRLSMERVERPRR